MVTKKKRTGAATKKGPVKVGTLKLKEETIKDLSNRESKGIKGGLKGFSCAISFCRISSCS